MSQSAEHQSDPVETDVVSSGEDVVLRPLMWLTVWTLSRREITRFLRQRSRLIGALATPIMFWVLFGAGLHESFQAPGWAAGEMSYREFFLPGITALILMFTAIFSAMSIIEDRHEGFLQGVLVSPASRPAIVLGKVLGGTFMAVVQALGFVVLGWLLAVSGLAAEMQISLSAGGVFGVILFMALLAFGLTALGFMLAWKLDSIQGFHAIMNLFLMPMWLLSGSFFPVAETGFLSVIMQLNPLTYGVAGIRQLLYTGSSDVLIQQANGGLPSLTVCFGATAVFALVTFCGAVFSCRSARVR
jgi:ABC-2 type transport system permease protein